MRKTVIYLFVLVILSCTFFTACHAKKRNRVTISDRISSRLCNIVLRYADEFRNFSQLQNSMEAVYESRFNYSGTARENILRSYWLSTDVHNTYRDCINTIDWGCQFVIENIPANDGIVDNMLPKERDTLLTEISVATSSLQYYATKSLESFKLIPPKLIELKNSLDAISNDLHNDCGPGGFYGPQKQEILELNTAREIVANFNGDLNYDENTMEQFTEDQYFSKMQDLLHNCNELRKWHASNITPKNSEDIVVNTYLP